MALQKLEVLRSNFLFGKNKSSEVESDLSAIKIKNHEEAALPEFTYGLKKELNEIDSANVDEELKVFVTADQDLLKEYYKLREISYRTEFGFENYDGSQNEFDVHGRIIIATNSKNEVIGGMRIMLSTDHKTLSAEIEGTKYNYRDLFASMNAANTTYCEMSAIVVAKEYRNHSVIEKMFDVFLKHYLKPGECKYLVGVSTAAHCRIYRMAFGKLGYHPVIKMDYPWLVREDHNNLKEFPVILLLP